MNADEKPGRRTTNLGVRSSNLFGRATQGTEIYYLSTSSISTVLARLFAADL